jgi:hypothetical protein
MDPIAVVLIFGAVFGFGIMTLLALAFLTVVFSAYQNFEDPYDDLHEEKEHLEDHKAKRQQR